MTKLFEREYYRITSIAAELGCTVNDLIHFAANERVRLGVLYDVDGFFLGRYFCLGKIVDGKYVDSSGTLEPQESIREFSGFAYVDGGYFKDMERLGGNLIFNSVELIDGRVIGKGPLMGSEDYGSESRSVEQIFIHADDLKRLLGESTKTIDRSCVSDKLAKMNQASTKFWGNANRADRGTHPDNAKVAAWLVQQGFSPTLADKAATIIRPEWAPTGRKPEE